MGLISHEDWSGCRKTPMDAAWAIALVYSLDAEDEVTVTLVDAAVTESGVGGVGCVLGGVGG